MILTILRVFTVVNALIGIGLVAGAVWPSPDPTVEKEPFLVIVYLLWALFFFVLTWQLFYVKPIARKWAIGLYGFISFVILWLFLADVIGRNPVFVHFPGVSISIYLIFFMFFVSPVVFMFRRDVKEFFTQFDEDRIRADEQSARASLKSRD